MFGLWKRKKPRVIESWHVLMPDCRFGVDGFYRSIEEDLATRDIPGLTVERIEFAEGGLLSAKRQYLRLRRERLVFDICSAPFGTSWFFSSRSSEIPARWHRLDLLIALVGIGFVYLVYPVIFGLLWGTVIYAVTVIAFLFVLNALATSRIHDLDSVLLRIPVLGSLYEMFVRKETYYREDTRNMYLTQIDRIVRDRVNELASANDIEYVNFQDTSPPPLNLVRIFQKLLGAG